MMEDLIIEKNHQQTIESLSICLIDDNDNELEAYRNGINNIIDKIFATKITNEAKIWIEEKNIDVLICDYDMPYEKDGITFLTEIRHFNNSIKLILLTGFTLDNNDVNHCKENNIEIISKTYNLINTLKDIVYYLLKTYLSINKNLNSQVLSFFYNKIDNIKQMQIVDDISNDLIEETGKIIINPYEQNKLLESYRYYYENYELIKERNKEYLIRIEKLENHIKRNSSIIYIKNSFFVFLCFFSVGFFSDFFFKINIINDFFCNLGMIISFTFYLICILIIKKKR